MDKDSIEIRETIPFNQMCDLVNDIVSLLFDDNGEYLPERYDYVFWVTVSNAFAGFGIDMTADMFINALYCQGWMDKLYQRINALQLDAIKTAVKERVQRRLNENPLLPLAKSLTELVDGLNSKLNDVEIQNLMDVMKNVKEINADSLVKAYINQE